MVVLLVAWAAVLLASALVLYFTAPGWRGGRPSIPPGTGVSTGIIVVGTLANELAVLGVLLGHLWLRRKHRRVLIPLEIPTTRGFMGTLLLVVGAIPAADLAGNLVQLWAGSRSEAMETVASAVRGASTFGMGGLLFALAALPAVVEELLFRGVITACFGRSPIEAVVVPSVLFGAFHLEPQQAAATAVLGIAFGLGRLYTGSVLPTMVAHAIYNAGVLFLMRYLGPTPDPHIAWEAVATGTVVFALGIRVLYPASKRALPS